MATRFVLQITTSAGISSLWDSGWEQIASGQNWLLYHKPNFPSLAVSALTNVTRTVPITTTQDIFAHAFYSRPLSPQTIAGTFSLVVSCSESAITANVTLAVVLKVVSPNGVNSRGTLFSTFNTDTEFAVTAATRIVNAVALTPVVAQAGDRIALEIGGHAAAPTAATSYIQRFGNSAASDFALTSGLTTDLNPWCEFSQDLFPAMPNNYQGFDSTTGMSTTGKIR